MYFKKPLSVLIMKYFNPSAWVTRDIDYGSSQLNRDLAAPANRPPYLSQCLLPSLSYNNNIADLQQNVVIGFGHLILFIEVLDSEVSFWFGKFTTVRGN
jgi:hypothetical protein